MLRIILHKGNLNFLQEVWATLKSNRWIQIAVIACAYFITARLSLLLAFQNTNASPIWPPSGIAFAFVLLFGVRVWTGIFIGAFLANLIVFTLNQFATPWGICLISVLIAIGNALEVIAGYYLFKTFIKPANPLFHPKDVLIFFGITLVMCSVSAFNGPTWLCALGYIPWELYHKLLLTWWIGDVVGVLTVMPILWAFYPPPRLFKIELSRVIKFLCFVIFMLAVNAFIFGGYINVSQENWPLAFIIYQFLVWSAFWYQRLGAAITTLIIAGYSIWGTLHGFGPFGYLPQNEALIRVELSLGILSFTGMIISATLHEREIFLQELNKSRQRFKQIFEFSSVAKIIFNENGNIEMLNKTAEEMFGYSRQEIHAKSLEILFPERFRAQYKLDRKNFMTSLISSPIGDGRELCALSKQGVEIPIEIGLSPIELEEKFFFLASIIDISARHESERVLREREEQYRQVINTALDAVISIDEKGLIIDWNQNAEKIFGWKSEEILGKRLSETIIPLRYRQSHNQGLHRYLATGQETFTNKRIKLPAINREGKEFSLELSIVPIKIQQKTIFTAFLRDISESENIELALKEREAHFRTMVDHSPAMVWMSGLDAKCHFFNKSWLEFTGRTLEQEFGDGWSQGVHPDDLQNCLDIYLISFRAREKFTMDYRLKRADGQYRWILDYGVPLYHYDGTFLGYIGSCIDITDLKRAQEILANDKKVLANLVEEGSKELIQTQLRLEQSNRLAGIGTLAATVAHELRNPLGVIQMASYNLKRKNRELENDKHLLNINKKILESNQIINNLLHYSRIKQPNYQLLNICKILDDSLQSIKDRTNRNKIHVQREYPASDDCFIEADSYQLQEIFNRKNSSELAPRLPPLGRV